MHSINYDSKQSIRGAFGEALAELGRENKNIVALMPISRAQHKLHYSQRNFPKDFLMSVLPNRT